MDMVEELPDYGPAGAGRFVPDALTPEENEAMQGYADDLDWNLRNDEW